MKARNAGNFMPAIPPAASLLGFASRSSLSFGRFIGDPPDMSSARKTRRRATPSTPRSHQKPALRRWTLSACIFQSALNCRRDSPAPDSVHDPCGPSNPRSASCGRAWCPPPPPPSRDPYKSKRRIYLFPAAIVPASRRRFVPRGGSVYGRPAPHPRSNRAAGLVNFCSKRPWRRPVPLVNARVCVETSIHRGLPPGPLRGLRHVGPRSLALHLAGPGRCVLHLDGAAQLSARTRPATTSTADRSPLRFVNTRTFATSASARHSSFLHSRVAAVLSCPHFVLRTIPHPRLLNHPGLSKCCVHGCEPANPPISWMSDLNQISSPP